MSSYRRLLVKVIREWKDYSGAYHFVEWIEVTLVVVHLHSHVRKLMNSYSWRQENNALAAVELGTGGL